MNQVNSAHKYLAPDPSVNACIRDEVFFMSYVEESAVRDLGLGSGRSRICCPSILTSHRGR